MNTRYGKRLGVGECLGSTRVRLRHSLGYLLERHLIHSRLTSLSRDYWLRGSLEAHHRKERP